mmetsp:Transcript_16945/g.29955  ORF Transcript_16945/g.29955 Transcript_16945/m.29955 type:complete len:175 (+) Transcript_16945:147-671(+)
MLRKTCARSVRIGVVSNPVHQAQSQSMSSKAEAPNRLSREEFKYWLPIQTRWSDNDMYGHVNNVVYYSYFDTVVNHFLINQANLRPTESKSIGLCVASQCQYFAPLEYPSVIEAGLFVSHSGRSSLKYEIGIFEQGKEEIAAHGNFTHVFVDAQTRKSVPIPGEILAAVRSSLL